MRQRRIGELATATGLTVRTLHHYDEIGLLVPSERSSAGYEDKGVEEASRGAMDAETAAYVQRAMAAGETAGQSAAPAREARERRT